MNYKLTKSAPTEMTNFIGINYLVSKIDGNEYYPVTSKIYQRQDEAFSIDGDGHFSVEELESIFETFMCCEGE